MVRIQRAAARNKPLPSWHDCLGADLPEIDRTLFLHYECGARSEMAGVASSRDQQ